MESVLLTQLAVSALVILFGAFLGAWARRNERTNARAQILPVAVALLLVVWLPHRFVDMSCAMLVGLVLATRFRDGRPTRNDLRARLAIGLMIGIATWGLLQSIPGGTSALLALAATALAVPPALRALPSILRVRRAARLEPGEQPEHEVHVAGRLGTEAVAPPPTLAIDEPMGAWRLTWPTGRRAQPDPVELRTPQGVVLVDLERVEVMSSEAHRSQLETMEAMRVAQALEDDEMLEHVRRARSEGAITALELSWLPPGAGIYVVGRPTWRRRAGSTYRDGALVPCFSADEAGDEPVVFDQSSEELRRHLRWEVLRGGGWGLLAGFIALLEVLRRL